MNAIEAMKNRGKLTLATRRGSGACSILVSDTGPGIPPEIRDKIFNLYFSTKDHGSGIGLAMAFRFVQLHDGKIEVLSQVGGGTTFCFSFPEAAFSTQSDQELTRSHWA
jgi:signal transduction histidine kinase